MYIRDELIIEELSGDYDGFGGVFTDRASVKDGTYELERKRKFWETDWNEIHSSILDVFDESNGICAVHEKCINETENFKIKISDLDQDDGAGLWI